MANGGTEYDALHDTYLQDEHASQSEEAEDDTQDPSEPDEAHDSDHPTVEAYHNMRRSGKISNVHG